MRLRTWSAVMCLLLSVSVLSAQSPLADRIPAGAIYYVGWAGRTPAMDASTFGKMTADPACEDAFKTIKESIAKAIPVSPDNNFKAIFDNAWSIGGLMWQHPTAVALLKLEMKAGSPAPAAVLLIDLGKDQEAFSNKLDGLLAAIGKNGQFQESLEPRSEGTVNYRVLPTGKSTEVAFGFSGQTFFLCVGDAGLPSQLLTLKPEQSLAADKQFAKTMDALGVKDAQSAFYEDIARLMTAVDDMQQQTMTSLDEAFAKAAEQEGAAKSAAPTSRPASQMQQAMKAMGLNKATVSASVMKLVEGGVYSKSKLFSPAPHTGLLKLTAGGVLKDSDLALVPADADCVMAAKISASGVLDELLSGIGMVDQDMRGEFEERIADVEKTLGVSFRKDLLDSLGDTWVCSSASSQGGFLTGSLITVDVKDADKLARAMSRIEAFFDEQHRKAGAASADRVVWVCPQHSFIEMSEPGKCPMCESALVQTSRPAYSWHKPSHFAVKVQRVGKTDIHYIEAGVDDFPLPLAPAWAIHEGRLYVAGWPQVIVSAIQTNPAADKTASALRELALIDSAAFKKARAMISGKPSVLVYVDTAHIVKTLYPLLLAGWTMGSNALNREAGIAASPTWLPTISQLTRNLGPYVCAVSYDDEGITCEEIESVPGQKLISGVWAAPMLATVAIPRFVVCTGPRASGTALSAPAVMSPERAAPAPQLIAPE